MTETVIHKDNDTPLTSDAGIKRMDADTPFHPIGAPVPAAPVAPPKS